MPASGCCQSITRSRSVFCPPCSRSGTDTGMPVLRRSYTSRLAATRLMVERFRVSDSIAMATASGGPSGSAVPAKSATGAPARPRQLSRVRACRLPPSPRPKPTQSPSPALRRAESLVVRRVGLRCWRVAFRARQRSQRARLVPRGGAVTVNRVCGGGFGFP